MPANLYACPPVSRLEPEEANVILLDALDYLQDDKLRASIKAKVPAAEKEAFTSALVRHPLLSVSTDGVCSSTTFYGWVWHPDSGCGAVYEENPDLPPEYQTLVAMADTGSRQIVNALAELLWSADCMPVNFLDLEVHLTCEGLETPDLIDAMARGVFAKEPDLGNALDVARRWVEKHSDAPSAP